MNPKKYALIGGILMLALGLLAMIPTLSQYETYPLVPLTMNASYGMFLGMFPMNILNKIALIVFGLLGIWAATVRNKNLPMSVKWSRAVLFIMGPLAILGMIPETSTLNGTWPLYGAEVWVHGVFALLGAIFGYTLTTKASKNEQVQQAKIVKFRNKVA